MGAKRKIIVSILSIAFMLIALVATFSLVFGLTQHNTATTIDICYTTEDIDGSVAASYTIGGTTKPLVAMDGETKLSSNVLSFEASDTELVSGNKYFKFPSGVSLTADNDNLIIEYSYSNTGDKHYIASMSFGDGFVCDNMAIEYSIDGTNFSDLAYDVIVPSDVSNRKYWIKISIIDRAYNASFNGNINWNLDGCDEEAIGEAYKALEVLNLQLDGDTYVASYSGGSVTNGEFVVPGEVNGVTVTSVVGNKGLSTIRKAQVTSVVIPDTVTTLEESAFEGYPNLTTVTFEQNANAVSVQSTTGLTRIGSKAFAKCDKLTDIVLPSTVTEIGAGAFKSCYDIDEFIIPNGVTNICDSTFENCVGLINITMPEGITSIGANAFKDCTELVNIQIPRFVQTIGQAAFSGCLRIVGEMDLENATSIGARAFKDCSSLTKVSIGGDVSCIESQTFSNCESVTEYYLVSHESMPALNNVSAFNNINQECKIYVIDSQYNDYVNDVNWSRYVNNFAQVGISNDGVCEDVIEKSVLDFKIYGNSIQDRGKNLIPKLQGSTKNGVTLTVNADATVNVSGKASVTTDFLFEIGKFAPATYTLSGCPTGGGTTTYRLLAYFVEEGYNLIDTGSGATYKLTQTSNVKIQIRVYAGTTLDVVFRPQLEYGSQVTEYVASNTPSPDIPVKIQSVGERTKNLLPINGSLSQTTSGVTMTLEKDIVTLNGVASSNFQFGFYLKENKLAVKNGIIGIENSTSPLFSLKAGSYVQTVKYLSGTRDSVSGTSYIGMYTYKNGTNLFDTRRALAMANSSYSFTLSEDKEVQFFVIQFVGINSAITFNNYQFKVQLEEGTTATEYEPYGYKIPVKVTSEEYDANKYTIIGTPSVTEDGIASGFEADSYVDTGYEFSPGCQTWQMGVRITTGDINKFSGIVGSKGASNGCTPFFIDGNGNWCAYLSSNGTSWDIAHGTPIMAIETNTTYWLKTEYTGVEYVFSYSLDGTNWQIVSTIKNSLTIFDGLTIHLGNNRGNASPFMGKIDLSKFYIKIGDNYVFTGGKEVISNIYLDEPLRKVGNYVDYIDLKTGNVVRNVRYVKLNIADMNNYEEYPGWTNQSQMANDYPAQNITIQSLSSAMCNITTKFAIGINTKGTGIIFLTASIWGQTQTEWMSNYPDLEFEMIYGVRTPEEYKIDLPDILTANGTCLISLETTVQPSAMSIKYYK